MDQIHNPYMAGVRLIGALVWTLPLASFQAILLSLGAVSWSRTLARWYWSGVAEIMGLRIAVHGERSARRPVLFVANHTSYLDIIVLGALVDAAFVAKTEVRGWPGIGVISRLGRTVFVDRQRRSSRAQRDDMLARLTRTGESLILFPEGTSHDGNRVRSFKSALFAAADQKDASGEPIAVQPISVAYTRLDGLPIGRATRAIYAWYGDMSLAPHLWTMAGLGNTTVEVEFHAPVTLAQFESRKALAEHCQAQVARGQAMANAGRTADPEPLPAE